LISLSIAFRSSIDANGINAGDFFTVDGGLILSLLTEWRDEHGDDRPLGLIMSLLFTHLTSKLLLLQNGHGGNDDGDAFTNR